MNKLMETRLGRLGLKAQSRARKTIDVKWWHGRAAEGPFQALSVEPGPHLFLDWRHVQAGLPGWLSRNNQPFGLRAKDIAGPIDAVAGWHADSYAGPQHLPEGVRLVAQTAHKTEPLSGPHLPGDVIVYDNGSYRSWNRSRCYESLDGLNWNAPQTCQLDWSSCPVSGGDELTAGVLVDSAAPPEERFKTIVFASLRNNGAGEQLLEEFLRTRPDDIDPQAVCPWFSHVAFGAVSPDGLRWKVLPRPFLMQVSDTLNVLTYDQALRRYAWYGRCWWHFGRRCIFRSESADFRHWSAPEMVVWPSLELHPADDWYTNSKTMVPSSTDQHLMFPTLFHRAVDSTELHLFSSPDGIVWSRVPGGPVLQPGAFGDWDGGCLFGGVELVPLPENRVGIIYTGCPYPHKYPRNEATLTFKRAYAWWPKGRLCALEATESGSFATFPLRFVGRKLVLNVATLRAGKVLVEASDLTGKPLAGRSLAEADPIVGDFLEHTVSWRGESDIGHAPNQPVVFRFQLRAAKLFAFEFQ